MNPTITSVTHKLLSRYPDTTSITLYLTRPVLIKRFDSWMVNIACVKLFENNKLTKLTPEDFYDIFETYTHIVLGKNTKNRQIAANQCYVLTIDPHLKTFTTKDGKTISYYPTEYKNITSTNLITKVKAAFEKLLNRVHELKRESIRFIENNYEDLPDFDSD